MTAFDGSSDVVSVYFDDESENIHLSLTDDPTNFVSEHVIKISPDDVEQIVEDLLTAYFIRTGAHLDIDSILVNE